MILKGVLVTPTKLLQLHHTILEEVSLIYFVKLLFICKRLFFVLCTNPPKSSTGEIENGKGATHCQYAATPYTFSLQYCMPLRDLNVVVNKVGLKITRKILYQNNKTKKCSMDLSSRKGLIRLSHLPHWFILSSISANLGIFSGGKAMISLPK